MAATRVVLFDVMDTLVADPFFRGIESFFGCSRRELLGALNPGLWPRFERNEVDAAAFYAGMFRDGRPVDGDALQAWLRPRYAWLPGTRELVEALAAAEVPMGALSNYPVWMEWLDEELGLSRWLDLDHVSYRTGVRKPEPEAYLGACMRMGVQPAEALFVDDREENCAAARAVGLAAHRFDGAEGLAAALQAHGLLMGSAG